MTKQVPKQNKKNKHIHKDMFSYLKGVPSTINFQIDIILLQDAFQIETILIKYFRVH